MKNLGQLFDGKVSYSSGWGAIVMGIVLASSIAGEQLGFGADGRTIIAAVLQSNVPFLIAGGFAVIGMARKLEKLKAAKEIPPDSAAAELETFKKQLQDILNSKGTSQ